MKLNPIISIRCLDTSQNNYLLERIEKIAKEQFGKRMNIAVERVKPIGDEGIRFDVNPPHSERAKPNLDNKILPQPEHLKPGWPKDQIDRFHLPIQSAAVVQLPGYIPMAN